ncbi:MAG: hypothetical protein ABIQ18_46850 [Umezawaea sp.]
MNDVTELVTAAELVARVLSDHPDLPPIAAIMVGSKSGYGMTVQLQLHGGADPIAAVAHWAQALNTTVTVQPHGTYVALDVVLTVDGRTVLVWDHLDPFDAVEVFARLGLPLPTRGTHVEISPAELLRAVVPAPAVAV